MVRLDTRVRCFQAWRYWYEGVSVILFVNDAVMIMRENKVRQYRTKVANIRVSLRYSGLVCALDIKNIAMKAWTVKLTNSIILSTSKKPSSSSWIETSLVKSRSKLDDRTLVGYSAWKVIFSTWVSNRTKLVLDGEGLNDLASRVLVWLKLDEFVLRAGFKPGVENRRSDVAFFIDMPWVRAHRSWNSTSFSHSEQYNGPSSQVISVSFCLWKQGFF